MFLNGKIRFIAKRRKPNKKNVRSEEREREKKSYIYLLFCHLVVLVSQTECIERSMFTMIWPQSHGDYLPILGGCQPWISMNRFLTANFCHLAFLSYTRFRFLDFSGYIPRVLLIAAQTKQKNTYPDKTVGLTGSRSQYRSESKWCSNGKNEVGHTKCRRKARRITITSAHVIIMILLFVLNYRWCWSKNDNKSNAS